MNLPSLDSERFDLRPLTARDTALYVALYTDAAVMRHVAEPMDAKSASQAFSKVESLNRRGSDDYRTWVIVEKATGQDIGLLALVAREGIHEIGALIWPEWHNGGVATEIIRRLMDFAFAEGGSQAVFTRHRAENGGAEGLMRKLDFQRIPSEGHRDGGVRWERTRARWQRASGNE
ncbi:GNAT family N-acetyltransferase [Pseudoxanthomonas japonensis]|uniref:GNAT family N-acetyltransferase n=1 Tax=Pseudoxanthomonas japonensis TaxID=69284 RepID=UPI001BCDC9D9|nr:GNAT family N-acetyltransferase [Pseudoxanthomonas japonensis]